VTEPRSGQQNRLADEQSPYLLQHADNPVDWYPWGEEAFAKAKAEDVPVFLSIGYATCHWCHVMEHESFEDEAVAAYLNAHFVPVKVDREERPDVDEIYMGAVQALTGSGGWPLSVFLTPDGRPFFGGTYFPQPAKYGRISFRQLLERLRRAWDEEREGVMHNAKALTEAIGQLQQVGGAGGELGPEVLAAGAAQLQERFDAERGGFGQSMKFPTPHNLGFLLRQHRRTGDAAALEVVTTTLDAMARGGLRDHLAGGFHRYAVDPEWTIPHFEKMLYDQAGLVVAYTEARLATGEARYADVARETVEFVLGEMRDERGGFTSAYDADSEGVEGKFYVWTAAELREALGEERSAPFAARYGVTERGNFHELPGANHLQVAATVAEVAERTGRSEEAVREALEAARRELLALRRERVPPLHDDKVLADWNGLMIGALAVAARGLDEPRYAEAAAEAAGFVLEAMRRDDGRLLHRYRAGQAGIDGLLDDYAFMTWGLLRLYEATYAPRWLEAARELAGLLLSDFWDDEGGGFYMTAGDAELLIHRSKPVYDGAIPAGGSVAAGALLELGRLLQDDALYGKGQAALEANAGFLAKAGGVGGTWALQAVDFLLGPTREVVVAGDPEGAGVRALLREVHGRFLPRTLTVQRPADDGAAAGIVALVPFVAEQGAREGRPTAYVCRDYACRAPVHEPDALGALLDEE